MWFWLTFYAIIFVLLLIIEELIYYFWNRYVYGPNVERKTIWKKRIKWMLAIFRKKPAVEIRETNHEESSL